MGKIFEAWLRATRPQTLPVSVAGVLAGGACALMAGSFDALPFAICMLFALCAQIVSNFANEYFDFANGLDRKGREGFRRGVTEGDIAPAAMKRATFILLAADCLLGLSLVAWGGWILLPVGFMVALFALGYSTGPWPLSHHGLGDIAVVIFFGLVPVIFTTYVQSGSWEQLHLTLPIGFATGLLASNVLIVNNYRDAEDDAAVGKHTSVVILGRQTMACVYAAGYMLAVLLIEVATRSYLSVVWSCVWLAFALAATLIWRRLIRLRGEQLNGVLRSTALLMLAVTVALLINSVTL